MSWCFALVLHLRFCSRCGSLVSFRVEISVLLVQEPFLRRLSRSGTHQSNGKL